MMTWPNKITGANAGGSRPLPMRRDGPPASLSFGVGRAASDLFAANVNASSKIRFTIWGAVIGLTCAFWFALFALVTVPVLQDNPRAVVEVILFAGAFGGILGLIVAMMKDESAGL